MFEIFQQAFWSDQTWLALLFSWFDIHLKKLLPLPLSIIYMGTFRDEFFIALNNWQRGWGENQNVREQISEELLQECELLDYKFRMVASSCYRKRFIHYGEMQDILLKDYKHEGLTSWTTDVGYAETFKALVKDDALVTAIFEHNPIDSEVVLNVNTLWSYPEFMTDLAAFQGKEPDSCNAIHNFKDLQREVILNAPLRGSEICAIVGKSSSFDKICDEANIPEEQRPAEYKRLVNSGVLIEEIRYVRGDSARRGVQNAIAEFRRKFGRN